MSEPIEKRAYTKATFPTQQARRKWQKLVIKAEHTADAEVHRNCPNGTQCTNRFEHDSCCVKVYREGAGGAVTAVFVEGEEVLFLHAYV